MSHVEEALRVLELLGLPRAQLNERSALTLLALLDLTSDRSWSEARDPLRGITPMMKFFEKHYGKRYAPNTRETVRRQTVHQILDAGLIVQNPDDPRRAINSPFTVYQIAPEALALLKTFRTPRWKSALAAWRAAVPSLRAKYAAEREQHRLAVDLGAGETPSLSPGGQNPLVKAIVEVFAPRFAPKRHLVYVGDTGQKFALFDEPYLRELGVTIDSHGKMPDVVVHHTERDWLLLIEAVTNHGPIGPKRKGELAKLFEPSRAGLVYVTAFLDRRALARYLHDIAWETEVWVAESPTHLLHFNGERFLGPHEPTRRARGGLGRPARGPAGRRPKRPGPERGS